MVKSEVQFVVDAQGNRTGFILPPEEYEAFMDYLDDADVARAARESDHEPVRPFKDVLDEMRAAGEINV